MSQRYGKIAARTDHIAFPNQTPTAGFFFDDTVMGMIYIEPNEELARFWFAKAELQVLNGTPSDGQLGLTLGPNGGTGYGGLITIAKIEPGGSSAQVAGAVAAASAQQAAIRGRRGR